jgi:hypothetical protein
MRELIVQHKELWLWLGSLSIFVFVASLVIIPIVIVRMGEDYFLSDRRREATLAARHPALRWTGFFVKNALAVVLIVAGLAMVLLPGQGLLTIIIGLMLANFPGKRSLELWLLRRWGVLRTINKLRNRYGRPPLRLPTGQ